MRIIFCKFLKKMSEGHDYQFYPGKIGEYIYQNISKEAWKIWIIKQTKIINEEKLNMNNIQDYKKIEQEMYHFFLDDIIISKLQNKKKL